MVGMIVLTPSCKFIKAHNPFNKKEKEMAIQRQIDSIRVADSLRNVAIEIKQKAVNDSLAALEAVRSYEDSFRYHVIIGSFVTPEYATAYADFYSRRGVKTEIIDMVNSRFKLVSASASGSLTEACKSLKAIRDTIEFESWVYVKQ